MSKESTAKEINHFWDVASDHYAMFGSLNYKDMLESLVEQDAVAHYAVAHGVDFILGQHSILDPKSLKKVMEHGREASLCVMNLLHFRNEVIEA